MVKRSLSASQQGIKIAKNALIGKKLKQQDLVGMVCYSRQPISKFFNGKTLSSEIFVKICEHLDLKWQEIAENTDEQNTSQSSQGRVGNAHLTESLENTDKLVTQLRQLLKADIETRCGTMRIFDMSQLIELGKIYTSVNILEKITSYHQPKDIKELLQTGNADFDRFNLGKVTEEGIPGKKAVSKYKKLLIFGKPGAGKTTFLKHIAIECIKEEFQGDLVPFFITLKKFAETETKEGLLTHLKNYLTSDRDNLETVLENGKALILLDGLDEVLQADTKRVVREIETLSDSYPNNQYLMTCRIAAKEYTFTNFTEVEIADFNDEQIATFAHNWFKDKPVKPEAFLKRLEKNKPIKELVSNPLLLTLLCITVDNKSGKFPTNRRELYKDGIKELLKKWDISQGVERDIIYRPLSIAKKEDLLSKIAWETFTSQDYFFKQDKAERLISEYIRNLPGANLDDEALQGDSEIVLKNIEAQHGLLVERAKHIYSFSHLTFQEYFTAREIITVRQSNDDALQELVSHLFKPRWREVFLLAVAMSPNAERLALLMKQQIDSLLADDANVQRYLWWLKEKAQQENIKFQLEDVDYIQEGTKFYINSDICLVRILFFNVDISIYLNQINPYRKKKLTHYQNLNSNLYLYRIFRGQYHLFEIHSNVCFSFYTDLKCGLSKEWNHKLDMIISNLQEKLPGKSTSPEDYTAWRIANGKTWMNEFRQALIQHCNIAHDWQFSEAQKTKLEQYYRANQLLTQCLNQDCYVSPEVRQYIEETLLLPIAEIKPFSSNT